MNDTVSIVMTSYNYAQFIAETIESVINQTYTNWELIIIDDCSSDNSIEIIQKYAELDKRIKLFVNTKNLGLCASVKKGIEESNSEWIAFLESDDTFMPNSLEEKIKAVNIGADIIFTGLNMIGDEAAIKDKKKYFDAVKTKHIKLEGSGFVENINKIIPFINIIPTFSVVLARKDILLNCDFNPLCKSMLDYYLWAQLSFKKFYYLDKNLTNWRIHKNSYINTSVYSWFTQYLFFSTLYYNTVLDKNIFIRLLLLLNNMRKRLLYIKITKHEFKINFASGIFIYKKQF